MNVQLLPVEHTKANALRVANHRAPSSAASKPLPIRGTLAQNPGEASVILAASEVDMVAAGLFGANSVDEGPQHGDVS
jgi:hypothetical protein